MSKGEGDDFRMCRFATIAVVVAVSFMIGSSVSEQAHCNQSCDTLPRRRVCASDGFIYRNICQMQKWACLKGVRLEQVPDDWCRSSGSDRNDDDDDNSDSSSDEDSREGKRRRPGRPDIPTIHPFTKLTRKPTIRPVTNTKADEITTVMITKKPNGRTTTTTKLMTSTRRVPTTATKTTKRASTTSAKTTTNKATTASKTTKKVPTTATTTNRPQCPTVCPLVLDPVCGTDGNTYTSECVLRSEACFRNEEDTLQVAYDGPCITTLQPVQAQ